MFKIIRYYVVIFNWLVSSFLVPLLPFEVFAFVKVVTFHRLGLKDSTLAQQLIRQLYPSHSKGRNTH